MDCLASLILGTSDLGRVGHSPFTPGGLRVAPPPIAVHTRPRSAVQRRRWRGQTAAWRDRRRFAVTTAVLHRVMLLSLLHQALFMKDLSDFPLVDWLNRTFGLAR